MAVRYGVQAFGGFNCVPRYASTTPWSRFHTPSNRQVVPGLDGLWHDIYSNLLNCTFFTSLLMYLNIFPLLQNPFSQQVRVYKKYVVRPKALAANLSLNHLTL